MNPKLLALYNKLSKGQALTDAECREMESLDVLQMRDTSPVLEMRLFESDLCVREANKTKFPDSIGVITGRFTKYSTLSRDLGGFQERVMPGAFTDSLASKDEECDVRALVGHNKDRLIGRRSAGTLEIRDEASGPSCEIYLVDTTECRDAHNNTKVKNYKSMSFGFKPQIIKWKKEGTLMVRELHKVKLGEVSLVTTVPAYPNTELAAREMKDFVRDENGPEMFVPVSVLRMRHNAYLLRDLSTESPSPQYGSEQEKANMASYQASHATRSARSGDAESHRTAKLAHEKAAKLHESAAKTAPAHHEALAAEHKALAKMHNGKA